MTLVLVLEAVCVAVGTHAASIFAVVMVFAFEAFFTWGKLGHLNETRLYVVCMLTDIGWMATVWIYPPEILPLSIRGKGSSLAAASDFVGNFIVRDYRKYCLLKSIDLYIHIGCRDHTSCFGKHWMAYLRYLCRFQYHQCCHSLVDLSRDSWRNFRIHGSFVHHRL